MTVRDLVKTDNIIRISSDDSLTSALALLSSSHDAAFVFEKEQFLGVINPYYSLIKTSYPANTSIKHALVKPPRVRAGDRLEEAARLMMESKIHYLPVFDNQKFLGIITSRRILNNIHNEKRFQGSIGSFLGKQSLVTVRENDPISKAMALFKEHRISKLVVISPTKTLIGILAYYDIITYVSSPRERQNYNSRQGERDSFMEKPVRNFFQRNVLTLTEKNSPQEAIKLILDKQIGSVIIIEPKRKPVGIITTKDILKAFAGKPVLAPLEVYTRNLSQAGVQIVNTFSQRLGSLLNTRRGVSKAKITITEKKQGNVFEAVLAIFQKGKQIQVVRLETKDLNKLLKDVKRRWKRLLAR